MINEMTGNSEIYAEQTAFKSVFVVHVVPYPKYVYRLSNRRMGFTVWQFTELAFPQNLPQQN